MKNSFNEGHLVTLSRISSNKNDTCTDVHVSANSFIDLVFFNQSMIPMSKMQVGHKLPTFYWHCANNLNYIFKAENSKKQKQ